MVWSFEPGFQNVFIVGVVIIKASRICVLIKFAVLRTFQETIAIGGNIILIL
jgi:hypothetical protein